MSALVVNSFWLEAGLNLFLYCSVSPFFFPALSLCLTLSRIPITLPHTLTHRRAPMKGIRKQKQSIRGFPEWYQGPLVRFSYRSRKSGNSFWRSPFCARLRFLLFPPRNKKLSLRVSRQNQCLVSSNGLRLLIDGNMLGTTGLRDRRLGASNGHTMLLGK